MKGIWKPTSQVIDKIRHYRAMRQINTDEPLHGGNVEYCGNYTTERAAVIKLCEYLNMAPDEERV